MNKKKRNQLIILCLILFVTAAAFGAVKLNQKKLAEAEAESETESYQVVEIDSSQVTDIGIISSKGTVNLTREGEEWKCPDEEGTAINSIPVENLLASASSITSATKIENVEDMSQYGLSQPAVNLTLQWDDNMYNIKLGDYNSIISGYYLSTNDENTVYVIDSGLFYALDKGLEDFEAEEEEAEE
ncbi:MAG: DUF4340 domain-containing protein [Clostridium sp.]|nr:DUF4340 domain-containing protein [Clostridium sp.]